MSVQGDEGGLVVDQGPQVVLPVAPGQQTAAVQEALPTPALGSLRVLTAPGQTLRRETAQW